MPTIECSSCNSENEAGRKFCGNCGARLGMVCGTCGTSNPPGVRFCGECGTGLTEADAPVSAPAATPVSTAGADADAPESRARFAERRLVSVLFADLVGFTPLSEARDAEEIRDLLSRYFARASEVVGRYSGEVEKFIGDAVVAVWGTPVAHEDDAERAVRAALDLVDAIRQISEEAQIPELQVRVGVLTGEVAVTIGADNEGMVAGDVVVTASRLQSVAPPGTVLVGESTMRTTSEAIAYEPAGDQMLKGKAAPVPAFRALRVVARRGGEGRSELLEPPFVGRDAELRLLKDFYHGTARERGVRLVSVIGQGGIGKTRLAWEFQKYLDGITEPVLWQQGRSPSYGDGISFWALGEMIRMRAGIGEGADEATTRSRIRDTVARYVLDPGERPELETALLQLLGVDDGSPRERDTLFLAWRTFIERLSETATVVLVYEDLQWADTGLLDFIEYLLAWSRGRPIYIVTLSRPELLDRRPTWGAGHRSFTSLGLGPLSQESMRELLTGVVPGMPEPALREIVRRAEGVPLYAVETVRMLVGARRLVHGESGFEVRGTLDDLGIPESLHALIASRLDALAAEERSVVQDASVLGLSFSVPALAAIHSADDGQLEPLLRRLVQREVLTYDDDARSPERGQYAFVQSLVREVAYGTLSRADRRTRHLAAARYYEAQGDEELSGVLAEHYVEAYRAHPNGEEGAAVGAQARIALSSAAARAVSVGSPARALTYLEQALELTDNPREKLGRLEDAAGHASTAGKFDRARLHCEAGIELAERLGDRAARRRLSVFLANVVAEGNADQGLQLLENLAADPDLTAESPEYALVAGRLSAQYMRMGRNVEAVDWAERVLAVPESQRELMSTVEVVVTRGTALANLGRTVEATMVLMGAWEFARRHRLLPAAARAAINLGYALEAEDARLADQVSRQGLEVVRSIGNRFGERYLLGNAVDSGIEVGDWDWIRTQLDEQLAREDLEPLELLATRAMDVRLRSLRGEDVTRELDEVLELANPFHDLQITAALGGLRISVSLASGELEEVRRVARELLDVPQFGPAHAGFGALASVWLGDIAGAHRFHDAFDARPGRRTDAQRRQMAAGIALLEGESEEARSLYRDAVRLWHETGSEFSAAVCQLTAVLTGAYEGAEREAAADEARSFFDRVGARPFLAKLEAADQGSLAAGRTAAPAAGDEAAVNAVTTSPKE